MILPILELSIYMTQILGFLYRLALVVFFLAFTYTQINLQNSVFIIHRQRHYCQSFGFLNVGQFLYLFFSQKQFAVASWIIVLRRVFLLIWWNETPYQKGFFPADSNI